MLRQIFLTHMTKTHSKLLAGALLLSFLVASNAHAAYGVPLRKTGTSTPRTGVSVCERIEKITEMLKMKVGERQGKLGEKRTTRMEGKDTRRTTRDTKLDAKRDTWDSNREARYAKLLERADSDAKKEAVASFKKAIEDAVSSRKAAIDKAIEDFRVGIDALGTKRKGAVDEAVAEFKESVDAVIEDAKSDCKTAADPKALVESIRLKLMHAREDFAADMKAIDLKSDRDALVAARKAAIEKAIADFKAAGEKAKSDLKSAFGQA